eukprot:COSAG01_NODE_3920_length_5536_cov_14.374655_7_plen_98_part_00
MYIAGDHAVADTKVWAVCSVLRWWHHAHTQAAREEAEAVAAEAEAAREEDEAVAAEAEVRATSQQSILWEGGGMLVSLPCSARVSEGVWRGCISPMR